MSKTHLPYLRTRPAVAVASGVAGVEAGRRLPDDHLAWEMWASYPTWWTSWTCGRSPLAYESRERRGGPPYHPRMMVKVLLYGYCVGVQGVLTPHRPASPRGHRLQGVGGEQHTGSWSTTVITEAGRRQLETSRNISSSSITTSAARRLPDHLPATFARIMWMRCRARSYRY